MKLSNIPVIVIGGPTAVGKTDLSIHLAKQFNGEIINGDSLQVYRNLNIGTGKITTTEMDGVPHHLLDILDEHEPYDASQFKKMATTLIKEIASRGKLPIIVGGTGLYLEGLLYNLEFGGESSHSPEVRQHWQQLAQRRGSEWLWQQLQAKDPQAAALIPYQNTRRVIRALEVIEVTGELFSKQESHEEQQSVFNECVIILERPREALYERINRRVQLMVEAGLEQEARALYDQANGADWQSIKGIGYKEWWPYFDGHATLEEVVSTIQQNSRRYAKRQLTWFRNRLKHTHWVDVSDDTQGIALASAIVKAHLGD
ncbi:tRNA (adenosine(37)-N6)-dimethylallyltransferase MiaA [Aerococcaceae bacterium NML190073]|nr:tRNA (adenosine(37)-N6)-dimethylallyltransferase MiaA [Aerococcaceae bacterium NML190073]